MDKACWIDFFFKVPMVRDRGRVYKEDKQNSEQPMTLHRLSTWEGNHLRLIRRSGERNATM